MNQAVEHEEPVYVDEEWSPWKNNEEVIDEIGCSFQVGILLYQNAIVNISCIFLLIASHSPRFPGQHFF